LVLAILNALVAIPKIAGYVQTFASAVVSWYVSRQTQETLSAIADAAALAANAKTDDEKFAAAQKWQTALAMGRVVSN